MLKKLIHDLTNSTSTYTALQQKKEENRSGKNNIRFVEFANVTSSTLPVRFSCLHWSSSRLTLFDLCSTELVNSSSF